MRDILFSPVNGFINNCVVNYFINKSVDFSTSNSAYLFLVLLMVRKDSLAISNIVINSVDLQCLIEFICTAWILSLPQCIVCLISYVNMSSSKRNTLCVRFIK